MERELPVVTLDLILPGANLTVAVRRLGFIDAFYGEAGRELFHEAHDKGRLNGVDPLLLQKVDNTFFGNIGEFYGSAAKSDPRRFYKNQLRESRAVIDYLVKRLNGRDTLGLKNEVQRLSTRPSDAIKLLALPEDQITARVRLELIRGLCLAHTAGILESRAPNGELTDNLFDAQRLLDEHVFSGPIGEGRRIGIYSYHDPRTLSTLGFCTSHDNIPDGVEVKYKTFEMRDGGDIGPILTNEREKPRESEIVKAYRKAAKNGGIVKPEADVTDSTGIMFVALDASKIDVLIQRVYEALKLHPQGLTDFEYDPETHQSKHKKKVFERYQAHLGDEVTPIELIFYTMKQYLNQEYEIGEMDVDGFYDGRAHDIYELWRIKDIAPHFYPEMIYGVNAKGLILNPLKLVVDELRGRNRVMNQLRVAV